MIQVLVTSLQSTVITQLTGQLLRATAPGRSRLLRVNSNDIACVRTSELNKIPSAHGVLSQERKEIVHAVIDAIICMELWLDQGEEQHASVSASAAEIVQHPLADTLDTEKVKARTPRGPISG